MTDSTTPSTQHPTVDLPAMLEGPRLPTTYAPADLAAIPAGGEWIDAGDLDGRLESLEHRAALEDVRETLELPTFPAAPCPRCAGLGSHGLVHVRHGNGGGHNERCPLEVTA